MSIEITLRRKNDYSPFRQKLLQVCKFPVKGYLILCTGYIWEDSKYSILDDDLLSSIYKNNKILCIAGKIDDVKWLGSYKNFVQKLKTKVKCVKAVTVPEKNWHAKIALKLDEKQNPIVAIIGSSNLTRPAYGENPEYDWNYECDVIIWRDEKTKASYSEGSDPSDIDDLYAVINAIPDPKVSQPTMAERLIALKEEILKDKDKFCDLFDVEPAKCIVCGEEFIAKEPYYKKCRKCYRSQ